MAKLTEDELKLKINKIQKNMNIENYKQRILDLLILNNYKDLEIAYDKLVSELEDKEEELFEKELNTVCDKLTELLKKENEHLMQDYDEDGWIEVIFNWADKYNIHYKTIPRDKATLLAIEDFNIGMPSYAIEYYYDKDGNQMNYIPDEITNLLNLKTFNIQNHQLEKLPKNIGNLINLESIDISCNNLEYLPDTMEKLVNLKSLNFGQNHNLKYILGTISNCTNLESISAYNTGLDELPVTLALLKKLKYLNLSHTKLCLQQAQKDWLFSLPNKGCEVILDSTEIIVLDD